MPPCHTTPFVQPGVVIEPAPPESRETCDSAPIAACDYCGSSALEWRKCKLVCSNFKQINKSCADL
jgi:hypothetical protein